MNNSKASIFERINQKISYAFSESHLTSIAGTDFFFRFLEKTRFDALVAEKLRVNIRQKAKTIYSTVQLLKILIVMRTLGAFRIEQFARFDSDPLLCHRLKLGSFPVASTIHRFLQSFLRRHVEMVENINSYLVKRDLEKLKRSSITITIDSTPITVYGTQEKAEKGYNPSAKGKRSYHPLIATLSTGHVLKAHLRPGDTYSSYGALEFLRNALAVVPARIKKIYLRADSGFFSEEILQFCEARGIGYVIAAKRYELVKESLSSFRNYHPTRSANISYRTKSLKLNRWKKERIFLFIRTEVAVHHSKELLIKESGYSVQTFVTNIADRSPWALYRFYKIRARIEKEIEEIKNEIGLRAILGKSFMANSAYFQIGILTTNLVLLFDRDILPLCERAKRRTLTTIRWNFFMTAARFIMTGRAVTLKLEKNEVIRHKWRIQEQRLKALAA